MSERRFEPRERTLERNARLLVALGQLLVEQPVALARMSEGLAAADAADECGVRNLDEGLGRHAERFHERGYVIGPRHLALVRDRCLHRVILERDARRRERAALGGRPALRARKHRNIAAPVANSRARMRASVL